MMAFFKSCAVGMGTLDAMSIEKELCDVAEPEGPRSMHEDLLAGARLARLCFNQSLGDSCKASDIAAKPLVLRMCLKPCAC